MIDLPTMEKPVKVGALDASFCTSPILPSGKVWLNPIMTPRVTFSPIKVSFLFSFMPPQKKYSL
jgi:hypothetical protein